MTDEISQILGMKDAGFDLSALGPEVQRLEDRARCAQNVVEAGGPRWSIDGKELQWFTSISAAEAEVRQSAQLHGGRSVAEVEGLLKQFEITQRHLNVERFKHVTTLLRSDEARAAVPEGSDTLEELGRCAEQEIPGPLGITEAGEIATRLKRDVEELLPFAVRQGRALVFGVFNGVCVYRRAQDVVPKIRMRRPNPDDNQYIFLFTRSLADQINTHDDIASGTCRPKKKPSSRSLEARDRQYVREAMGKMDDGTFHNAAEASRWLFDKYGMELPNRGGTQVSIEDRLADRIRAALEERGEGE